MQHFLIRISEVFHEEIQPILNTLGAVLLKKLGQEYFLIELSDPKTIYHSSAAKFIRWKIPVQHSWPCNPQKMERFIEKAGQALEAKFSTEKPEIIRMGQLDASPGNHYFKLLSSNLRGRTLQLFPTSDWNSLDPEKIPNDMPVLFTLVGKEGLFAGISTTQDAGGVYPGGTKFINQNSPDTISRAGAKIAEALHFIQIQRHLPTKTSHWLELGASPGGMTSELLKRSYRVTAVDRAPLDKRLRKETNLTFFEIDVAALQLPSLMRFDALLCDMNGSATEAMQQVVRLSKQLKPKSLIVYTMKTTGNPTFKEMNELYDEVMSIASEGKLQHIDTTHLTYNRHEFTIFFSVP